MSESTERARAIESLQREARKKHNVIVVLRRTFCDRARIHQAPDNVIYEARHASEVALCVGSSAFF